MHVEPLEKLPRSVREFLSHYAMIVLSILTALALEQVVLGIEHRHQGERARTEIEREIRANHAAYAQALAATRENLKLWDGLLVRAVAEVDAGLSTDASRLAILKEAGANFRDATPPLGTAAWEAALADHAVDYLAHDELTRFSELYATQRFFAQALWDTVRDSGVRDAARLSLPHYLGKADPEATIALLNGRVRVLNILTSQLQQIDAAFRAAETPAGDAAAPAH